MPDFRRGIEAIEESQQSMKGGRGGNFLPQLQWREDKEDKYILFLNPIEEVPVVDLHEWIPCGEGTKANGDTYTQWESFLSRKDKAIGEDYDDILDRLGRKPRERGIGVAVELEPEFKKVGGRNKVTSFTVKTDTFERKTDDDGTEEVIQPVYGMVVQASFNFYGWLASYERDEGPVAETPMKVTRRGTDAKTQYDFVAKPDCPVDLTPLIEHLEGITYLREEMEQLLSDIDGLDAKEAAYTIGSTLLEKRLQELGDAERYERLVSPVEELEDRWGTGTKPKAKAKSSNSERPARPSRTSSRERGAEKNARFEKLRASVKEQSSD